MSLKSLIKVADYYNVKYGFGKVASSHELDYAIKMSEFHDTELKSFKDSIDPIYLKFAEIHTEARNRYNDLIEELSKIDLDGNQEITEEEKFSNDFRDIFNSWSEESMSNLRALSRKLSKKDPKDLTITLKLEKSDESDDKFLVKLRFLKALSDQYSWLNFNITSKTLKSSDAANEFSSGINLNVK